jgi:hypothetical protein
MGESDFSSFARASPDRYGAPKIMLFAIHKACFFTFKSTGNLTTGTKKILPMSRHRWRDVVTTAR